jgi:sodium transport system permease protein
MVIVLMVNLLAGQQRSAREITIPVVNKQYAPILVDWLAQQRGVQIKDGPKDAEAAVRTKAEDFVLVIDKKFVEKFNQSLPAAVKVISDPSRESSLPKVERVHQLLNGFNGEIASLRLVAHGVSPAIARVLKVDNVEISNQSLLKTLIFNYIPLFLMTAAFTSGMMFAMDATAGERERGSLEPLLINPVPRWQLIVGKWLAAALVAIVGMAATLIISAYTLTHLPLEDLGIRNNLGLAECVFLWLLFAPCGLMAPALQVYLACFAKSFKEAQMYMSFVLLAIVLPGSFAALFPFGNKLWLKPLPIIGQYVMATDILSGKLPPAWLFISSALLIMAICALCLYLAARLFSSEKIVVGR